MTTGDILLHIFCLVDNMLPEIEKHPQARLYPSELVAAPSFFTVMDTYPIEMLFPIREHRSKQQVGKKGRDTGRWSIGIKLCWLLNEYGRVVNWDWAGMNVYDKHFHPVVESYIGETIVLTDFGFRSKEGVPENLKLCQKGTGNERMCVETALSMVTLVCDLKRMRTEYRNMFRRAWLMFLRCSMCFWTGFTSSIQRLTFSK